MAVVEVVIAAVLVAGTTTAVELLKKTIYLLIDAFPLKSDIQEIVLSLGHFLLTGVL